MRVFVIVLSILCLAAPISAAKTINFGDDSSEYANDGECDDRRFIGFGMAATLAADDNFKDATDCEFLYSNGMIKLVNQAAGKEATQCDAIEFGNDASDWAKDGECDDPRFDGPKSAATIAISALLKDAKDCRAACAAGGIWLRVAGQ
ncbi:MAG: hypothetical protein AAF701_02635 [Pseudomonadota bacterium]